MKNITSFIAILCIATYSFAQSGPGGIGTSNGSGGTPINVIWLEADALGLANGNDITSWADQSGNSNDFSVVSTYSPIFRNVTPLNGHAYAEFSKSNNRIVLNPFSGMPGTEITTLVVYKTTDSGDGLLSYAIGSGSLSNEFLLYNSASLNTYIENSNHNSGVANNSGAWQIMTHRWRSSDGDLKYFQDGSQVASTTHKTGATINQGGSLAIGGEQDAVDGGYVASQAFSGDIAEVIMYDSYLNDAQRRIIENYLSAKYNISIGANDLYAGDGIRNYDYGVIGIGKEANGSQLSNSSTGLILTPYGGTLDVNGEYIMAGHDNKTNAAATDSLGTGIQQRWFKSWYIDKTTSGTLGATITFDFGDGIAGLYPANNVDYELVRLDLGGTNKYEPVTVVSKTTSGDRIAFEVDDTNLIDGFYTLGTTDMTTAPVTGVSNTDWYSYKTGNWSDPLVWTTDPSGATRTPSGGGVPTSIDNVEILSGRTITADADNLSGGDFIVDGKLDVNTKSGLSFKTISGTGTIAYAGSAVGSNDNFPSGDAINFADTLNGGTVEIYGTGINLNQTRTFNKVKVNLDAAANTAILTADWIVNGYLDINQGVVQINDGTSTTGLNVTVYGDLSVQANGQITTGSADARHQLNLYGDFTNSGTVKFTNRVAADYNNEATNGIVDVNFLSGDKDQVVDCLGSTTFYRIEVDKGTDETYILDINASSAANFNLYGPANYAHGSVAQLTNNDNALGLLKGTVRINANVDIPVLSNTGNYNVSEAARLWVNGGSVIKPTGTSLVPYGTIQLSAGTISSTVQSGITTRDNGNIVVSGGTLTTNQIRTSVLGVQNIGGYTQSGGIVNVTGGNINNNYYTFSLTHAGNTFNMSGGTLNISGSVALQDNTGSTSGKIHGGALFINAAAGNYNVTGGTVIIDNNTATNAKITSSAPLWNLTLTNTGGLAPQVELDAGTSGDNQVGEFKTIDTPTLKVLNNLVIESGVTLDHNGFNVEIGSDFVIENGGDYIYKSNRKNTTTINGVDNSLMAFYNRTGGGSDEQKFWNLVIDKQSGKTVKLLSGKTNVNGNNNNLLNVQGNSFKVLSGTLDQGVHSIRVYTDTLVNYDDLTIYEPVGAGTDPNPNSANDLLKFRPDPFVLLTADTSTFGNVRLNNGNNVTTMISDIKIQRLEYRHGRLNLQNHNLMIDSLYLNLSSSQAKWNGCSGCNSVEDMFIMDGKSSDGGLSLKVSGNQTLTYPIGVGTDGKDADVDVGTGLGTSKYTPATVTVTNYAGSGYITIRPVDKVLAITNPGGDILSYYWRVDYSGFTPGNEPTVQYQYKYYDADLDGSGNEGLFVPGKVLDDSPFTRSSETIANINTTTNLITFNGDLGGGEPPFTLEKANYTAGEPVRFTGSVEVYYSHVLRDAANARWSTSSYWTTAPNGALSPHDSRQPNAADYPKAGDIAYVGWVPWGDPIGNNGKPHGMEIDGTETFAELRFTQMTDSLGQPVPRDYYSNFQYRPTVCINPGGVMNAGAVRGEGAFWMRSTGGSQVDPSFSGIDMGDFVKEDSSYMIYESTSNSFVYNNIPAEVPNLLVSGNGWGANDRDFEISTDVTVKKDLELLGDVNLILSSGATGDFYVEGDLKIFELSNNNSGGGGELAFPNNASRTVEVLGDVQLINQNAKIDIRSADATVNVSNLIVHGNILQDNTSGGGLLLSNGAGKDYINLKLSGTGNHAFNQLAGSDAKFYTVTVDKGTSTSASFTFNGNFTLDGPTSGAGIEKALTISNGLAVINNSSINIDLTTGDDDFIIPGSAGLEVTQGTVNVSGSDSGIRLDGSLIIDGGTVNMDDPVGNGNNYIEYGSGGNSLLQISSGSLTVGSQIRPLTSAETGILKYRQTGGTVIIGKNNGGDNSRGMLQIYNAGSEFTYTGGTLEFVRHQATPAIAALYLDPDSYDVTGSTITIFNTSTPAGQSDFRINSVIPLNNVLINDTNSPTVNLNINPLEIDGTLTVNANATLDANGLGLTLLSDWVNNGTYVPNGNTTTFSATTSQSLTGTGTFDFFNLTKNQGGTLNIASPINIANTLFIEAGSLDDGGNTITALGDVIVDGTHSSSGGSGIVFAGSAKQQLSRSTSGTGALGTITINNANGVEIPDGNGYNFNINGDLRLQSGVFNIGGALISVATSGDIVAVSPFGLSNMVQTNSSFTDNGLQKNFPAGYSSNFTFPIGQLKYTPVVFNFSDPGHTFGTTSGSITVRPANEYHPTVNDGTDFFGSGDVNNVLQYYWILSTNGVNGLTADVTFYYDQTDVKTAEPGYTEADYIPARILSDNNPTNIINKFAAADVDEINNTVLFSLGSVSSQGISGDYFAGIDQAIPNNVATYTSVTTGNVDGVIYDIPVPGGGAPQGAVLVVASGTTVTFNINDVSLYKTQIQSGGTLLVDGTDGHRLGTVTGTGTLKLVSNTNSVVLPAGFYTDFFSCTGGGLEYAGTGSYDILGGIPNIRNLTLSGSGDRNFPNTNVSVCEDLNIDGATVNTYIDGKIYVYGNFNLNTGIMNLLSGSSSRLYMYGNFIINNGIFNSGSSGAFVVFEGGSTDLNGGSLNLGGPLFLSVFRGDINLYGGALNSQTSKTYLFSLNYTQHLRGNFTGSFKFYYLYISNQSGNQPFEFEGDVEVLKRIDLVDGIVNTNGNKVILDAGATVTPAAGQANSYINGTVEKTIANAGESFTFPIGSATRYRPASVTNVSAGGLTWDAEYVASAATADPLVSNLTPASSSILTMSTQEYWKITDNQSPGSSSATVGLSWGTDSYVSSVPAEREQLEVMVWNSTNTNWDNFGGDVFISGHSQSQGSFNSATPVTFSQKIITLGSTDMANPLPVELVSFTGVEKDGHVDLSWSTASELNNDYFIIEHAVDGRNFEEIGEVTGAGTINITQNYTFTHNRPAYPDNYYRLKQVDFDGVFEYSDVILVKMNGTLTDQQDIDFVMYPNPTNGNSFNIRLNSIDFSKPLVVEVMNISGRLVYKQQIDQFDFGKDMTLDLGYGATRGIYVVRLIQENGSSVKRLVLK